MSYPYHRQQKPRLGTPINKATACKLGLVACYLFNDNPPLLGKTYDLSGNNNTGTLVAGTHSVPGKFGPALSFDGTGDYVSLTKPIQFADNVPWTVLFRAKQDVSGANGMVLANATGVGFIWCSGGDSLWFRTAEDTDTKFTEVTDFTSYHDWVLTPSGTQNISLYKDGVLVATKEAASYNTSLNIGLIGRAVTHTTLDLDGQIEYVMIFNRTLSAGEIAQLYCKPFYMFDREWIELWSQGGLGSITIEASALALAGDMQAPSLAYDYSHIVSALAGLLAIQEPSLLISTIQTPAALSLAMDLQAPATAYDMVVNASAQTLTLMIHEPQTNFDFAVAISALSISLALKSPAIETSISVTFQGTAQALQVILKSPTINYDMTILAEALEAALSMGTAMVSYDCLVAAGAALAMALGLKPATIETGMTITFEAIAQGLLLSLKEPQAVYDFSQLIGALNLVAERQSILLEYDYAFDLSALPMSLSLFDPVVFAGLFQAAWAAERNVLLD